MRRATAAIETAEQSILPVSLQVDVIGEEPFISGDEETEAIFRVGLMSNSVPGLEGLTYIDIPRGLIPDSAFNNPKDHKVVFAQTENLQSRRADGQPSYVLKLWLFPEAKQLG
jgi:hypothetical protein